MINILERKLDMCIPSNQFGNLHLRCHAVHEHNNYGSYMLKLFITLLMFITI